jgi:hypothetical protein
MTDRSKRRLHYDGIMSYLDNTHRKAVKLSGDLGQDPQQYYGFKKFERMLSQLRDSKLFWIDFMTLDSLLNYPCDGYSPIIDFQGRMPFPLMFVDFDKSIEYRFMDARDKESRYRVGGLLFSKEPAFEGNEELKITAFDPSGTLISTMQRGVYPGTDEVCLSVGEGTVHEDHGIVTMNLATNEFYKVYPRVSPKEFNDFSRTGRSVHEVADLEKISYEIVDDDNMDAIKLANLSANTLRYINAQNVIIQERRRRTRQRRTQLKKKGKRGRVERVSRLIDVELKPFY